MLLLENLTDTGLGICIHKNADLVGGWYEGRGAGIIVSGTGRFEGVKGTFENRFSGRLFTATFSDAMTIFEQTVEITVDK